MIGVKKIAHATYETPDLDKQIEYYTDILGLNLIGKEKDSAYLASTIDHHSVVLRKGGGERGACTRLGFQLGPDDDLDAFVKQTEAKGIKTSRKKDPEPSVADMVTFEDPKGTVMEVFKRGEFMHQKFPQKGIVPHNMPGTSQYTEDVKDFANRYHIPWDVITAGAATMYPEIQTKLKPAPAAGGRQ